LKLLIDEMYPPAVGEQLRRRGHDAEAVTARADLRALSDAELFALAQREQRAIVTENIDDFSAIADHRDRRGEAHHGLILVAPDEYRRGDRSTIGRMVGALHELLERRPETAAKSSRDWL